MTLSENARTSEYRLWHVLFIVLFRNSLYRHGSRPSLSSARSKRVPRVRATKSYTRGSHGLVIVHVNWCVMFDAVVIAIVRGVSTDNWITDCGVQSALKPNYLEPMQLPHCVVVTARAFPQLTSASKTYHHYQYNINFASTLSYQNPKFIIQKQTLKFIKHSVLKTI